MLQNRKNKLTVSILSRLKDKGPPPAGSIQPFSPLGDSADDQEIDEKNPSESGDEQSNMLQVMYPPKRKKRRTEEV